MREIQGRKQRLKRFFSLYREFARKVLATTLMQDAFHTTYGLSLSLQIPQQVMRVVGSLPVCVPIEQVVLRNPSGRRRHEAALEAAAGRGIQNQWGPQRAAR